MKEQDDQLYIYKLYGISAPRKIKADMALRAKIGPSARIEPEQIKSAQEVIDNPTCDFTPHAMRYLSKIEGAIYEMRQFEYDRETNFNMVTVPLSSIRGQAGMFGNWLATDMTTIILKFLERYQRLDDDALDILEGYCRALKLSYDIRLYSSSSTGGHKILGELTSAVNRYNERFLEKTGRIRP